MVTGPEPGSTAASAAKAAGRRQSSPAAVKTVGILCLQGDFARHAEALTRAGYAAREVRRPEELSEIDGLVLPGGESTTMLKFFDSEPWEPALRHFVECGRPILATCAGAILLAHQVANPPQYSLDLIDVDVCRNAYGRQVDSFIDRVDVPAFGGAVEGVFIRAPKFARVGPGVEILGSRGGEAVLVKQGSIMAATFHPELTEDSRIHRAAFGGDGR
jgi:pyridoxal 5'-phosphate synthase pdxT subunit